jgi:hypothetical protein
MPPPTSRIKNATLIVMHQFPTATLDMNFSVTDSSCLAIILIVNPWGGGALYIMFENHVRS